MGAFHRYRSSHAPTLHLRQGLLTPSGAGPIGLLNLLCARAAGAHPIVLTDVVPSRLEFARTLVPSVQTVVVERGDTTGEKAAARVREVTEGGVHVALECTGFESSIGTAVYVSLCTGARASILEDRRPRRCKLTPSRAGPRAAS